MNCDSAIIKDLHLLKYWNYEPPPAPGQNLPGVVLLPPGDELLITLGWLYRNSLKKHFCPCPRHSLLCSWFMLPCASCCHWAKISQGTAEEMICYTGLWQDHCQWLAMGPNPLRWVFCGTQVSRGSAWLCPLSPRMPLHCHWGHKKRSSSSICLSLSPVLALRDHSISFLCLKEGSVFSALFQEMVNYGPTRALVFAMGASLA